MIELAIMCWLLLVTIYGAYKIDLRRRSEREWRKHLEREVYHLKQKLLQYEAADYENNQSK